jgi:hypothetical protein
MLYYVHVVWYRSKQFRRKLLPASTETPCTLNIEAMDSSETASHLRRLQFYVGLFAGYFRILILVDINHPF